MTQTPRDWQKDMEMCEAATPGPWEVWEDDGDVKVQASTEGPNIANFGRYGWGVMTEAIFTAEARTSLPYWLQEAKEQKERADAAEAQEQQLKEVVQLAVNDLGLWSDKILAANVVLGQLQRVLSTLYPDNQAPTTEIKQLETARPIDEWHEDFGDVLWWTFPIEEPPYCGTPLDEDWPEYHKHWTPIVIPVAPAPKEGEA
ncbi:hypothetical protein [Paenibacillus wynnii]|uniref:hypothetical protein n=1 Tax=Paenibacillus wynnii TaxID=268407 RepID=UPI00068E680A|nr:hypothetical protein [Paenibacillus wynnii]